MPIAIGASGSSSQPLQILVTRNLIEFAFEKPYQLLALGVPRLLPADLLERGRPRG